MEVIVVRKPQKNLREVINSSNNTPKVTKKDILSPFGVLANFSRL